MGKEGTNYGGTRDIKNGGNKFLVLVDVCTAESFHSTMTAVSFV